MTRCFPEVVVATRQDMLRMMPPDVGHVVAELGVFAGDWADEMLELFGPREMHLFDMWQIGHIECGDQNGQNIIRREGEELYRGVLQRFAGDSRVSIYRMPTSYIRAMRPGTFDFVYVDADHAEAAVYDDLCHAESVIRPTGIIAGHDFGNMFPGVVKAVKRFCKERPWDLWMVTEDGCPSFALRRRR
jgi:hypothetical protein